MVFDDMIAGILDNKKRNLIVTEFFIRNIKLNISIVFMTQSYFVLPKNIKRSRHYFITKIPSKPELQQISFNNSSDVNCKRFLNLYKNVLQTHLLFSY